MEKHILLVSPVQVRHYVSEILGKDTESLDGVGFEVSQTAEQFASGELSLGWNETVMGAVVPALPAFAPDSVCLAWSEKLPINISLGHLHGESTPGQLHIEGGDIWYSDCYQGPIVTDGDEHPWKITMVDGSLVPIQVGDSPPKAIEDQRAIIDAKIASRRAKRVADEAAKDASKAAGDIAKEDVKLKDKVKDVVDGLLLVVDELEKRIAILEGD